MAAKGVRPSAHLLWDNVLNGQWNIVDALKFRICGRPCEGGVGRAWAVRPLAIGSRSAVEHVFGLAIHCSAQPEQLVCMI